MSTIKPTAETVFSEAYWEPRTETQTILNTRLQPMGVDKTTRADLQCLTAIGIQHLLSDGPLKTIQEGTVIGEGGDPEFSRPGNVLFLDIEELTPRPLISNDLIGVMRENNEIILPGLALWRMHLMPKQPIPLPFPLNMPGINKLTRSITSADKDGMQQLLLYRATHTVGPQQYLRRVGAYVLYNKKDGQLTSASPAFWYSTPDGPVSDFGIHDSQSLPVVVGETTPTNKGLLRIREAALCIQGLLQTAPVRKRRQALKRRLAPQAVIN